MLERRSLGERECDGLLVLERLLRGLKGAGAGAGGLRDLGRRRSEELGGWSDGGGGVGDAWTQKRECESNKMLSISFTTPASSTSISFSLEHDDHFVDYLHFVQNIFKILNYCIFHPLL